MVRVLALIYKAEPAFTHGVFKHFHKLISVHAEAVLHLIAVKEDYYGVIRKELAQSVVQRVKIAAVVFRKPQHPAQIVMSRLKVPHAFSVKYYYLHSYSSP